MQRDSARPNPRSRRLRAGLVVTAAAAALILSACGSDEGESAQDTYCAAGETLRTDITALGDVDLVEGGTSSLEAAITKVEDDLSALREAASDTTADDVTSLEDAIADLKSASKALSDDPSGDTVSETATAIADVASSTQAVYDTLKDCP